MSKMIFNGLEFVNGVQINELYPICYDTEEREVGCWVDGKPLYQITLSIPISSVSTTYNVSNLNIDKCVNIIGGMFGVGFVPNGYWYSNTNNLSIRYYDNNLYIDAPAQYNNGPCVVTVQYTKTTDVAGSGTWNSQGQYAHHYSEDEKVVGTWIDGKPLYEKTITHTTNSIGGQELIDISSLNINRAYDMSATTENSNGSVMLNYFASSSDMFNVYLTNNNTKLSITHFGSWTMEIPVTVTLRYTKTTD